MRQFHKLVLPILVAAALLALTRDAQAGEPFHPIYQPIIDFYNLVIGLF
jgi:hypothetical protein